MRQTDEGLFYDWVIGFVGQPQTKGVRAVERYEALCPVGYGGHEE